MFDILSKIQERHPTAFIGGGSLRDRFYGKDVKDIDIFIPCNVDGANELYDYDAEESGLSSILDTMIVQKAQAIYMDSNLTDQRFIPVVYTCEYAGVPVDIVYIESNFKDTVDSFDLSINQIGSNGVEIYRTDAFKNTVDNGIITIENINRADRQKQRVERIRAKYPEFTITTKDGEIV